MCAKRQRHCREYEGFRQAAYAEWAGAETLAAVRASWGRFGGLVTMHRHGREHYRELGRRSGLVRRSSAL